MQATSRALKMALLVAALEVIAVVVAKFGRNPDLSHVKVPARNLLLEGSGAARKARQI